jgi:hypothetical protein
MDTKICKTCKSEKPIQEFHITQKAGYKGTDGYVRTKTLYKTSCKVCEREKQLQKYHNLPTEKQRKRRSNNTSNNPEYRKAYKLKNKYGLTTEEFSAMVLNQDNKCKICGDEMSPPQVDHNHSTGKVRSLLCRACNTSLGLLREDPQILRNMISYIHDNLQES